MGAIVVFGGSVFPTGLDNYPHVTDFVDDISADHMNSVTDAIENLEAKVGIGNSAVTTSLDYILKKGRHASSQPGGNTGSIAYIFDATHGHSGSDKLVSIRSAGSVRFEIGGGGTTDLYFDLSPGQNADISPADRARIIYNNTTHKAQLSVNGGGFFDILTGEGAIPPYVAAFDEASRGTVPLVVGSAYLVAGAVGICRALIGTQEGGTASVKLRRNSNGVLVTGAVWTHTGTGLAEAQTLAGAFTLPATGWYDIELSGGLDTTVALLKGLHLVVMGV